jgi:hypothetical protein
VNYQLNESVDAWTGCTEGKQIGAVGRRVERCGRSSLESVRVCGDWLERGAVLPVQYVIVA